MKKFTTFTLSNILLLSFFSNAYSSVDQAFLNIAYSNPAYLNLVKNYEVIAGDAVANMNNYFSGSFGPLTGTASSHQTDSLDIGGYWRTTVMRKRPRSEHRDIPSMVRMVSSTQTRRLTTENIHSKKHSKPS
jgi:hypothetical protein